MFFRVFLKIHFVSCSILSFYISDEFSKMYHFTFGVYWSIWKVQNNSLVAWYSCFNKYLRPCFVPFAYQLVEKKARLNPEGQEVGQWK